MMGMYIDIEDIICQVHVKVIASEYKAIFEKGNKIVSKRLVLCASEDKLWYEVEYEETVKTVFVSLRSAAEHYNKCEL